MKIFAYLFINYNSKRWYCLRIVRRGQLILTVFVFEKVLDYFESKLRRFVKRFDKTLCQIEKSLDLW